MPKTDLDRAKDAVRTQVWDALTRARAAQPTVHGRIPAFVGAQAAADRLAELPAWKDARIIKAVPDRAELPSDINEALIIELYSK